MPVVLHIPLILAKVVHRDGELIDGVSLQPSVNLALGFVGDRLLGPRVDVLPEGLIQEAIGIDHLCVGLRPRYRPGRGIQRPLLRFPLRFVHQYPQQFRLLPHLL